MDLITPFLASTANRGDAVAVIDGDVRFGFPELVERTGRLAAALRAFLGGQPLPVGILSLNNHHVLELFYAAPWSGGSVCPLNYRLAPDELVDIAGDAGIEILFADTNFAPMAQELLNALPKLRHIVHIGAGPAPAGWETYDEFVHGHEPLRESLSSAEDVACLYYTGGTTGRSKGVMLTHGNVLANARNFGALVTATPEDRVLHGGPLFHVAGGSRIYNGLTFGCSSVIVPKFVPHDMLAAIETHRVTLTALVPAMMRMLFETPGFESYDLSSWRALFYGASPISGTLLETTLEKLAGVELYQLFGQTETAPYATALLPRYHTLTGPYAGKIRSVGQPIAGVDVRVADEEGRTLPPGQPGQVLVRGPNVMKGYLNQPEATAEALKGGWMHTGDMGYFDEDGFLFIVDRIKDMIISGGENVYSVEVEDVLLSHPDVAECAVFGIPDARWGELVHAVIVPAAGKTPEPGALIEFCRARLGGYKLPRSISLRRETLPLSGANKVLKRELKAEFLKAQGLTES